MYTYTVQYVPYRHYDFFLYVSKLLYLKVDILRDISKATLEVEEAYLGTYLR